MSASTSSPKTVLIVGSGVFGVSTGLWMLKKGGYEVTIVDKSEVVPAPDAASTDLNKIIRTGDYADPVIAALNVDATNEWRKPEWEGTYHESGVLCLASPEAASGDAYVQSASTNVRNLGLPATVLNTPEAIRAVFPANLREDELAAGTVANGLVEKVEEVLEGAQKVAEKALEAVIFPTTEVMSTSQSPVPKLAGFEGTRGYINPSAGWAEARRAVEVGIRRFEKVLGGTIKRKSEVVGLIEEPAPEGRSTVTGVKLANGETLSADIIVIATGAWTPALFAQDGMGGLGSVVATGQSVAKMQLTKEEVEEYKDIPVMFDLASGFYGFPPNPDGIMKIAIHGSGYLNTSNPPDPYSTNERACQASGISTPRTALTPGAGGDYIPKAMVKELRQGLSKLYPKLAKEKNFIQTRLCWYLDSPNGDWLIDWHPRKQNVLLATAGSGHAFKFFPNIGREILARVEGTLSADLAQRWRFDREAEKDASKAADVREGKARRWLAIDELATEEDLAAGLFITE